VAVEAAEALAAASCAHATTSGTHAATSRAVAATFFLGKTRFSRLRIWV